MPYPNRATYNTQIHTENPNVNVLLLATASPRSLAGRTSIEICNKKEFIVVRSGIGFLNRKQDRNISHIENSVIQLQSSSISSTRCTRLNIPLQFFRELSTGGCLDDAAVDERQQPVSLRVV